MKDTLQTFVAAMRSMWGPLSSELVAGCREQLAVLAAASTREPWLADLHRTAPANRELHRDPDHGFVLLAHTEAAGLFRAPHDHGRAWVVYALQRGEVEMRTYARIADAHGRVRLVQRDSIVMQAGQALAYLPGDIHDTRCLSDTALLFRFTERDLRIEDRVEHRLTRYAERDGVWTPASA
jgi:predicted metal-dependent enzyme (double-stranded beta helix superfamily)